MIIGITGTLAAGKGTIVDILVSRGFKHHSVRDYLISEINKRGLEVNRDSMVFVANDLREKYGSNYIIKRLYELAKTEHVDCVIESIRAIGEAEFLKEKEDFYLFSVDAPIEMRYERAIQRKSETDAVSYSEFVSNEEREMSNEKNSKGNISKCMEMADFQFINDSSIEKLNENVIKVLNKIK